MTPMETLAHRVYMLRHERRMSQQELAQEVGCSPVTISNLETGKLRSLTIEHLVALSSFFGVSVDDLLGTGQEENEFEPADEALVGARDLAGSSVL